MRSFGRSKDEIQADAIARALVAALTRLEDANCDPEMVVDSMFVMSHSARKGVKGAVRALAVHYLGVDYVTVHSEHETSEEQPR